ncbi:uncharacterized protein LOC131217470 [Magnolia sinica]|uniref:uncharacterized protein LOC131217470 n=1 Tax=Magnolia sinica TaxID=86752 RepID=UPI0026585F66|nr:uncharacterized protein LOC131217470 [Magnolia sinica]
MTRVKKCTHAQASKQAISKDSEKTTSADDTRGDAPVSDILEQIALSDDSTHLILNEFLLATGTDSNKAGNAALSEGGGRSDWDNILYGVFRPSRIDVELLSWVYLRKDRLRRGMEIFQKLKEFDLYQSFCEEKFKHQCYMEAFSDLEDLCLEEIGKREQDSVEYVPHQSWEAVLRKRQEELAERKDDPVLIEIGRDAISTVLKEYQASNVTSNNKEDLRIQDNLHQVDVRETSNSNRKTKAVFRSGG